MVFSGKSTRDLAANKVNPAEIVEIHWENFTVIFIIF